MTSRGGTRYLNRLLILHGLWGQEEVEDYSPKTKNGRAKDVLLVWIAGRWDSGNGELDSYISYVKLGASLFFIL